MTTTPTASPELLDLDKLEALARAATPGPWASKPHGRIVGGPLRQYVNGRAQAQIAAFCVTFHEQAPDDEPERQQANTEFAAAANPAAVLALIALARRAQPEGEAPQAMALSARITGAHACFSEAMPPGSLTSIGHAHVYKALQAAISHYVAPLCGAQHAESGKEAKDAVAAILRDVCELDYQGGDWDAEEMLSVTIDDLKLICARHITAQQAAAPGAVLAILRDVHDTLSSESDSDLDHFEDDEEERECAPVQYAARKVMEVMDMLKAAAPAGSLINEGTSAPGTPEAPADLPRLYRFDCYVGKTKMAAGGGVHASTIEEAEQKARKMIDKEETIKFESNQPCHATRKCGICAAYERAAQLEGGQEAALTRCAAGRDGECGHKACPQLRDNEPAKSGRHCPLDRQGSES